jgi:hypothetical protein
MGDINLGPWASRIADILGINPSGAWVVKPGLVTPVVDVSPPNPDIRWVSAGGASTPIDYVVPDGYVFKVLHYRGWPVGGSGATSDSLGILINNFAKTSKTTEQSIATGPGGGLLAFVNGEFWLTAGDTVRYNNNVSSPTSLNLTLIVEVYRKL